MRRACAIALAALAAGGLGAEAAADDPLALLPVVAGANGVTVEGTPQSYCVEVVPAPGDDNDSSVCADFSAPTRPPRHRLPIRARDMVDLRFQDNPRIEDEVASVAVALGRTDRQGFHPRARTTAARVPGTADRWAVRLPVRSQDDTLEVGTGFVSFLVGVRARGGR